MTRARATAWAAVVTATAAVAALAGCNALFDIQPLAYRPPGGDGGPPGDGPPGGGDVPGSDAPSTTVTEACTRYVQRYCDWQTACAQPPLATDLCLELSQGACTDGWYQLPGSAVTPASLDTCADALSPTSCIYPTCQLPPGTNANGRPCASSVQCASGYCSATAATCGACGPSPVRPIGQSCSASGQSCEVGAACVGGVCIKTAALGESCSDAVPCVHAADHFLVCKGGRCVSVGEAGQPCDAPELGGVVRCYVGFTCDTGTNLCVAISYVTAKLGESCKPVDGGAVIDCAPGSYCPCNGASADPVCVAYPGAGETCVDIQCPTAQRCAKGLNCTSGGRCADPPAPAPPPDCGT